MSFTLVGLSGVIASEDPQAFVQRFYDWYAPRAASEGRHPFGFADAVKLKPSVFDPALARALQEDADAQAKAHDDIVGIDFDPILNSQDPDAKYRADHAVRTATGYRVNVYPTNPDYVKELKGKPAVTVDLAASGGSWVITDFEYDFGSEGHPDHEDVLGILRQLAQERAKTPTASH